MYYLTDNQKNIILSYCLGYYTPKKWNKGKDHHASIVFSDYILHLFKKDLIDRDDKYIKLAAEECYAALFSMNIDVVVRPLSHSERIPSKIKSKSLNILGEEIAKKLDAKYLPECIKSNRNKDSRIQLKDAGNSENRKSIIKNDKLTFNLNKNHKIKGVNPSVLIIDDISRSGATAQGIAKAIKSYNDSCDIYLFVLGETCSYSYVSEERMIESQNRNEKLLKLVDNFNKQQNKAKIPIPEIVEKDRSYDVDEMNIFIDEAKINRDKRKKLKEIERGKIKAFEEKQKIKLIKSDAPTVDLKTEKLIRKEFVNKKKKTLRKKGIAGDIFGFLGLITFIYFVFFYEPENQLDKEFKYDTSSRDNYSSFNNKKDNSSINDFKDRYEDAREFAEDNYEDARKLVKDNYEDTKKDIEKSFEKNTKEVLEFFNKNEKIITRNNSQKNGREVDKISSCSPKKQFHPYDIPARLSNTKSNFVSNTVKIYKNGPGVDSSKWNIYLEATQFHKGKFKRHRKKEKVVVRCFIDHEGRILDSSIIQNSNNNYFFEYKAKGFVRELKFIPANKDYKNVCMWVSVPVYFSKRR